VTGDSCGATGMERLLYIVEHVFYPASENGTRCGRV
jgi:hypothetical protein